MDTHGGQRRDPQLHTVVDEQCPEELCEYAKAITSGYPCRWRFTEVFSGPNAPLTRAAELCSQGDFGQRCDGYACS